MSVTSPILLSTMVALSAAAPALSVHAQGADTGSGLTQSRRGATENEKQSAKKGPVVHAGAGTTSASTTGNSGETSGQSKPGDKIEVPALPSEKLCEKYQGSSNYKGCLEVTLRKNGGSK